MRRWLPVSLFLLCCACGGAARSNSETANGAADEAGERAHLEYAISDETHTVLLIDGDRFRAGPVYQGLSRVLDQLEQVVRRRTGAETSATDCVDTALKNFETALVSMSSRGGDAKDASLVLLEFDDPVGQEMPCMDGADGGTAGARVQGRVLAMGAPITVQNALDRVHGAEWKASKKLRRRISNRPEAGIWLHSTPNNERGVVSLEAATQMKSDGFYVRVETVTDSGERAAELVTLLQKGFEKASTANPGQRELFAYFAQTLQYELEDETLVVFATLRQDVVQAIVQGFSTALVIYGIEKYQARQPEGMQVSL